MLAALLFAIGLGAFANDRAAMEADRVIRNFNSDAALLGQPVPSHYARIATNEFQSLYERIIVEIATNSRINAVLHYVSFLTIEEALRFRDLIRDFVERNGGQRIAEYDYLMGNFSVYIDSPILRGGVFRVGMLFERY